jgi:Bifunctional DNA primase/polymerase, N-terminal/Primase C terminal 2 (PriCT-2)
MIMPAKSNPCLTAALAYADMKPPLQVFAAPPGKKQSYFNKQRDPYGKPWGMTSDPDRIRKYWQQRPNANVAIATGKVSGIWVLETDTIEGHGVDGAASLAKLIDENGGEWPDTARARSPTGSIHYFWTHPGGNITIKNSESKLGSTLAPGVDVLGDGGMVIAPPSIKSSKDHRRYEWIGHHGIALAPLWLFKLVSKKKRKHLVVAEDIEINVEKVIAALEAATNKNVDENFWYKIMAAAYVGSDGDDDAYQAFVYWSAKSTKHKDRRTKERWEAFQGNPPSDIGPGTLYAHADATAPGWREAYLAAALATLTEQYAADVAASIAASKVTGGER